LHVLVIMWHNFCSQAFIVVLKIKVNLGTPKMPFCGSWMRIQWVKKRLEAFLHPHFSFWPFMLDYEEYPYVFVFLSVFSEKNRSQKYVILVYLGKLLLLALYLKFLHKNDIFLLWAQQTKWRSSTLVSTPIWIFEKFLKLNFYCDLNFACIFNVYWILIIEWHINWIYTMMFVIVIYTHGGIFRFFGIIFHLMWFFLTLYLKIL